MKQSVEGNQSGVVPLSCQKDGVYKFVSGFNSVNYGGNEDCVVIEDCKSFAGYFFRYGTYNNVYIKNDVMMTGGFGYASNPTNNVKGYVFVQESVLADYLADSNWSKHSEKLKAYDFDTDPDNILPEHTGYFVM